MSISEKNLESVMSDCEYVRLGDVCDVVNGFGFPEHLQGRKDLSYPFLKVSDMNASGAEMVVSSAANTVDDEVLGVLRARTYPAGTIIFPKVGGALLTNKKRILGVEATFDNNIMGLVPKLIEAEWLFLWMQTVDLRTLANTQALPSIRQSDVANLKLPVPPVSERQHIAMTLGRQLGVVERARKAAEEQLTASQALRAAYLRQVFGKQHARQWETLKIGEVAHVQSGYAFKSVWFEPEGVRLLRNANVFQGFISWDDVVYLPEVRRSAFEAYELNEGDIVLSLDRPVVAAGLKVARLTSKDVPALLLQRVGRFVIRSQKVIPDYLYLILQSELFVNAITKHDQSLGVPHVSPSQVEDVRIPVPSTIIQQRIAEEAAQQQSKYKRIADCTTEQLCAINSLPKQLLRRAFA